MEPLYFVFGWGAPVAAALFAVFLIRRINNRDPGSDEMQRIAALIRSGDEAREGSGSCSGFDVASSPVSSSRFR